MNSKDATRLVADSWQIILNQFVASLEESTARVDDLKTLETHHRGGRSEESLGGSLGGFGATALNIKALSKTLDRGSEQKKMSNERFARIDSLHKNLSSALRRFRTKPPRPTIIGFNDDSEKILAAADAHFDAATKEFKDMRAARLEAGARYDHEKHEKFFADFTWRNLEPSEIAQCPPFIVIAEDFRSDQASLAKLLALLGSGRPLNLLLTRSGPNPLEADSDPGVNFDLEMLPVSLRDIFFLQTHAEHPKFRDRLTQGLRSPRAAVISLLVSPDSERNGFRTRAEQALSSRAHPDILYNPEASSSFVSRFDLSENPALDRNWSNANLAFRSDRGEAKEIEREYTFADYAADEPGWKTQFSEMPADLMDREPIPLHRYLELPVIERGGRIPFVQAVGAKEQLIQLIPSRLAVQRTEERAALWKTLREFAGAANPHVKDAEKKLRSRLGIEKEEALNNLRKELEGQFDESRNNAIVDAMRGLARKLAGIDTGPLKLPDALTTSAPATPSDKPSPAKSPTPEAAAPAPASGTADLAWIESKRCTTCDECTDINKKIFAYNTDKQAYVADPKGGPFKDIVKAAKKCSAKIIHPGKPQDPNEKDLEKWIEKAAPFQ